MKRLLFIILLLGLSGCTAAKIQSLEQFYKNAKIEAVDKVVIQDGSTGASKTILEQEQISEFLSLIKDIEFTPQDHQEQRVGWRYGITLLDGEKEFKFTLNEIDDIYYDSNPDIHPIVDEYYKQLAIEEK
ncbi:hypothetical protein ACIQZG_19165 [Lysinibacillus sp. NPDC096418]|uniref:hypothetical protein n=1 Tax=Lysinibacillus sp. NPDC096418 TaxID=3364138 RepID=UPI0038034594